mmetsp:Transcript_21332/g.67486  ORF Transcript_21332/g.67486 Transcript_21332/m.67486 type:complete len:470 (+) Transcript_21332:332-1741(+)
MDWARLADYEMRGQRRERRARRQELQKIRGLEQAFFGSSAALPPVPPERSQSTVPFSGEDSLEEFTFSPPSPTPGARGAHLGQRPASVAGVVALPEAERSAPALLAPPAPGGRLGRSNSTGGVGLYPEDSSVTDWGASAAPPRYMGTPALSSDKSLGLDVSFRSEPRGLRGKSDLSYESLTETFASAGGGASRVWAEGRERRRRARRAADHKGVHQLRLRMPAMWAGSDDEREHTLGEWLGRALHLKTASTPATLDMEEGYWTVPIGGPHDKPSSRQDVLVLDRWLDQSTGAEEEAVLGVISVCLCEVARQVAVHCLERGRLLARVWNTFVEGFESRITDDARRYSHLADSLMLERQKSSALEKENKALLARVEALEDQVAAGQRAEGKLRATLMEAQDVAEFKAGQGVAAAQRQAVVTVAKSRWLMAFRVVKNGLWMDRMRRDQSSLMQTMHKIRQLKEEERKSRLKR